MKNKFPFHLAIPVDDLETCKYFYENILGCIPGRSSSDWADYDLFGHQLVLHHDPNKNKLIHHKEVDGKSVPVPHFGVILPWDFFENFVVKLKSKKIQFEIEPYNRFEGLPGEQMTMFFFDPAKNALEFKTFKNMNQIFEK
jgi:extradiol dioxygenase family protein